MHASRETVAVIEECSKRMAAGGLATTPTHILVMVAEMYEERIAALERSSADAAQIVQRLDAFGAALTAFEKKVEQRLAALERRLDGHLLTYQPAAPFNGFDLKGDLSA